MPEVGEIYNFGGDNYLVTRVEPGHFLTLDTDDEWTDAIEFTDQVGEGETATVLYVMALDAFHENYSLGEIDEAAEAAEADDDEAPPEATQLPADQLPPRVTTKPVEPDEPEAKPKG